MGYNGKGPYQNDSNRNYAKGKYNNQNRKKEEEITPVKPAKEITEENYVDTAETVICELNNIKLTTTQIRKILSMVSEIYNDVTHERGERLSQESNARIQYLRMRIAYESGRTNDVRQFVKKSDLLNMLKSVQGSKKRFLLFAKYMEALVAYHRFYGGKDS